MSNLVNITPYHKAELLVADRDAHPYVLWHIDCAYPQLWLVIADSFEDAYEAFTCAAAAMGDYILSADDKYLSDYIDGWHGPTPATLEDVYNAWANGRAPGVDCNAEGDLFMAEQIQGATLDSFQRMHG